MRSSSRAVFCGAMLLAGCLISLGADWTRFRGPQGLGSSPETGLPTQWSDTENIVWKTELPGAGTSSPITVGNRIYLTTYSGYAQSVEEPGDMKKLERHVVCLDRASGQIVWSQQFAPKLPESEYSGGNNSWHGYSSSTPASDGQRLYVFFGSAGVLALDLNDGTTLWTADVGTKTTGWGSGNSVLLYKDLLIVNASIESSSIRALSTADGKEVWRVERINGARNTPILVDLPGGKTELVVSLPGSPDGKLLALDPATGKELWTCQGIPDGGYVCPSVVANEGIVYAIGGRKNTALAVKAGGQGDVTESHLLWRVNKGSNVSSPVYYQGYLYWVHERQGTAICLDAKDGAVKYEVRLEPRPGVVYSSILAADGKLYAVSQHNGTFVLAAKPEFELLAHNTFGEDDNRANASPAVSNGQLLIRNDRYLYCIGAK